MEKRNRNIDKWNGTKILLNRLENIIIVRVIFFISVHRVTVIWILFIHECSLLLRCSGNTFPKLYWVDSSLPLFSIQIASPGKWKWLRLSILPIIVRFFSAYFVSETAFGCLAEKLWRRDKWLFSTTKQQFPSPWVPRIFAIYPRRKQTHFRHRQKLTWNVVIRLGKLFLSVGVATAWKSSARMALITTNTVDAYALHRFISFEQARWVADIQWPTHSADG